MVRLLPPATTLPLSKRVCSKVKCVNEYIISHMGEHFLLEATRRDVAVAVKCAKVRQQQVAALLATLCIGHTDHVLFRRC